MPRMGDGGNHGALELDAATLVPTPLQLITKIAALLPPPRAHRHRNYGVLAPNPPLRSVVPAPWGRFSITSTNLPSHRESPRRGRLSRIRG